MKTRKLSRKSIILLFLMFMLTGIFGQIHTVHAAHPVNGWFKSKSGYSYYYTNNKRASGWKKIDGLYYYFKPETGILQKRKIIKSADGTTYYYVGNDGARCLDTRIKQAVSLVVSHCDLNATKEVKLKQIYDYLRKNSKYRGGSHTVTLSNIPTFATEYLTTQKGECIKTSCGFTYVALVLGFEPRLASLSWHTWPEIKNTWPEESKKKDNNWYIYDLSREFNSYYKVPSWYKLPLNTKVSGTYKYKHSNYTIIVNGGKVKWTKA